MVMKRIFDLTVTAFLLPFLFPLLGIVALSVKCNLGGPVFFRQVRPGYQAQPFEMIKFRTMRDCRNEQGVLLPDHVRLTSFGGWLRKTSLDELPEFWNVLRGEMSLVGPRPLLMEYLPLYTKEQMRRHEVRPGITGWAQINGRNSVAWDEKFKLDVWYVDNQSLWLDVRILLITIYKVLSCHGVSAQDKVTVSKFSKDKS